MAKKTSFVVNVNDNVATILQKGLEKGTTIEIKVDDNSQFIELKDDIPYGHKIAIRPIEKGDKIIKYGLTIGLATKDILVGEHVHIHNVESTRGRGDLVKGR
jgi:altronate dehydratase small subunit